jgi:tRNA1Val (adenine37-N6)-methyltransferase
MTWAHISNQKKHTQDGCQLAALMKKAPPRRPIRAVDIGCGDGIITFEILRLGKVTSVISLDISPLAIKAMKKNLSEYITLGKVEALRASANTFFKNKKHWDCFDRLVINPPFFASGSGPKNKTDLDHLARHEGSLHLRVWGKGAWRLLKTGGDLYCVFPTERMAECLRILSQCKVEPKEIWWLKDDKRKRRFFLRATKGGSAGLIIHFDKVLKGVIQGENA